MSVLRVTTLNLLHDAVRTLAAPWSARRAPFVECIRALDPDVLCLQEVSARQLEHVRADLPGYEMVEGIATGPIVLPAWFMPIAKPAHWLLRDFFSAGEWCPILLRRGSFSCLASGSLAMPPPSRAFTPHAVHCVRAQSARAGEVFEIYNTHLGILPWREARTARELREVLDRHRGDAQQIVTGDFNSRPGGGLLRGLGAQGPGPSEGFRDAWTVAERREGNGTFHWGLGLPGPRIDHVLMRPARRVTRAWIVAPARGRGRISDHAPLTVEIDLESPV
jgi:endonuclease/exonuclease/phosphatase family metal-dependent hydrolase